MDIQFKATKNRNKLDLTNNIVSKGENVPEIKHHHCVLKVYTHCYFEMLLEIGIDTLPKVILIP